MVKKIGIVLLCATLGMTLQARDDISTSKLFVGLELSSTKVDATTELLLTDEFYNVLDSAKFGETLDSAIEYGIHLGAEKDDWRTTLLYSYYNDDQENEEITMHKGSMLLDYFIWSSGSDAYTVKPYLGIHAGYMSYEVAGDVPQTDIQEIFADDSGFFYGGQAGVAMTISDVVQLDLSYRYSFTSIEDTANLNYYPVDNVWLDSVNSLDNIGSVVFSLNYFY